MLQSVHADYQAGTDAPQYSIYAYDKYCADKFGHNQWQCMGHMACSEQAVKQASALFESHKFAKIEIKKKFFDVKKNCNLVSTFQVLEHKKPYQEIFLCSSVILVVGALGLLILEMM